MVASKDGVIAVPAFPIEKLVDTTGAGDLFAAGFLFGLVRDAGYENAGRLGALAAAEVIQHIGARPQVSLKELAQQNGLAGVVQPVPPCERRPREEARARLTRCRRGERIRVKTIAQGMPDDSGEPVVTNSRVLFLHARPRVHRASGIPRAL